MPACILVVDDEPDLEPLILQKFRRAIGTGDLRFRFAHDGVEALAVLDGDAGIDMVLSDINMPGMDGLALLEALQRQHSETCTVIVSAYGDMANIRTAMNRGAFDFITKPIDFADLETTVGKTLRHIAVLREARARQAAAERSQAALSRFFSPNIAELLAAGDAALDLKGQWREVAVLFTDIAGFTGFAEAVDPAILERLLNDYLGGMTDIVFAHDGTVAKIMGDALNVLFGAPAVQPDHAARAVRCALALDAFAAEHRKRWQAQGVTLGATRIGVHAGPAIVGGFGGGRFFDYTAYGDTVNTAARLETANKQLGTRICVSAAVADAVPDFRGRPVGDLMLRGRATALRAYEPATAEAGAYGAAFAKLAAGEAGAMPAFAALVGACPDDALAGFHLKRLLNGGQGIVIQLD